MSTSSSPGSSRSASPDAEQDQAATDRLAQLEAMLSASMGYAFDEDAPMEEASAAADESAPRRDVMEIEQPIAVQDEPAPTEQVAFRLFSTQKAPQTVIIKEAEEDWPTVPDQRIRAVADEDKVIVKQRKGAIASVVIDGASILAESFSQPLSRHRSRVTTRTLTHPTPPAPRPPPPSLAYLNADLPPTDALPSDTQKVNKSAATSSNADVSSTTKKQRRRPAQPKRQELRRPLAALRDVPLLAVPLIASQKEARPVVNVVATTQQVVKEKLKGNKRLSKERRELLRKKMGKNSKKNKRKKAKAKLKAQAVTA